MRKIAELPTDEGLDVMVEITPSVKALADSKEMMALFKEIADDTEEERASVGYMSRMLPKLIPVWFKTCRNDLLHIVRVVGGHTEEGMRSMGAPKAIEEAFLLFNDADFIGFFSSFVVATPKE